MFKDKVHFAFFLILVLIAAGAVWLLLYSTPQGLGLSDDSIAYIAGARSILAGYGYREAWLASNGPMTHFPPGFSASIALVGLTGLDPLRGARFVNALLFGANAFLLGLIGWRMTKSYSAGIILALLFAANASLLRVHAMAMSEPLYIFFSLLAFLCFSKYFETNKNLWLVLTASFTGAAYLTRYAGLALLATFFIALMLLKDTWRKRILSSAVLLYSVVPWIAGWSIRNKLVANNVTNRTVVYHPITAENIEIGIHNFSEFLVPLEEWRKALIRTPNFFVIVLSILALILLLWVLYEGLKKFFKPETPLPEILSFTTGLYIFGYLASILSSMIFFDASTKFKLRIVSPIYVSLLVLLIFAGLWLWNRRDPLSQAIVITLTIVIVSFSLYDTNLVVANLHKGGQGYASFKWYDSKTMVTLRKLPSDIRIYTNQPGPVYLYTGRPCFVLPDLVDQVWGLPRSGYDKGVRALHEDVLSGKAVLALFRFGSEDEDVQSVYSQLAEGLYLVNQFGGDKIYAALP